MLPSAAAHAFACVRTCLLCGCAPVGVPAVSFVDSDGVTMLIAQLNATHAPPAPVATAASPARLPASPSGMFNPLQRLADATEAAERKQEAERRYARERTRYGTRASIAASRADITAPDAEPAAADGGGGAPPAAAGAGAAADQCEDDTDAGDGANVINQTARAMAPLQLARE